jgi:hypothetical protein
MLQTSIADLLAHERASELRGAAAGRPGRLARVLGRLRRDGAAPEREPAGEVTIRIAGAADGVALRRLAELDSRALPAGELLVAEVNGQLRAALPVDGGQPVADPFVPTATVTSLLALRATQLRRAGVTASAAPRRVRHVIAVTDR